LVAITETLPISRSLSGENSKYTAGLIGLGRIGAEFLDSHLNAYLNNPRIKLDALCDLDQRKISVVKRIGYFSDDGLTFVQRWPVDILSICTPPSTHRALVVASAPYVKAIWLEKPIAETLEDADEIIRVCRHYNVLLQVNHQRRATKPKFTFSRGWLNTGTHAVDLLRQYFGEVHAAFKDCIIFKSGQIVDIEYIDSQEPMFRLEVEHSQEMMLPKMLEDIIWALDTGTPLYSPGEEARETLRVVLEMERDYETPDN